MAKTPVPKPNAPVKQGSSPFIPVVMVQLPPPVLGGSSAASPFTGPREDGSTAYLNNDAVTPIIYNGQNQTMMINQVKPTSSLPMHVLPGAASGYSKIP
jgi:hypothetical protein